MGKSIVFGANGYLGRHLMKYLTTKSEDVLAVGKKKYSIDGYKNYFQLDITQRSQFSKINFEVENIYFLSAKTGTLDSFEYYQEFTNVNELGLLNLLDYLKSTHFRPKIIFPSSRLVYRGMKNVFLSEESQLEGKTVYAINKIACENYLKAYNNLFSIPFIVLRICVPYGNLFGSDYSYGTIGYFLSKAYEKQDISLYGDGSQKRTFTHIEDITEIMGLCAKNDIINKIINIGSEDNMSIKEAAQVVARHYQTKVIQIPWPSEQQKIESGDTIFDDKKLKHIFNYTYKIRFREWIETLD
mgnify:CR=1 FL=1